MFFGSFRVKTGGWMQWMGFRMFRLFEEFSEKFQGQNRYMDGCSGWFVGKNCWKGGWVLGSFTEVLRIWDFIEVFRRKLKG